MSADRLTKAQCDSKRIVYSVCVHVPVQVVQLVGRVWVVGVICKSALSRERTSGRSGG